MKKEILIELGEFASEGFVVEKVIEDVIDDDLSSRKVLLGLVPKKLLYKNLAGIEVIDDRDKDSCEVMFMTIESIFFRFVVKAKE